MKKKEDPLLDRAAAALAAAKDARQELQALRDLRRLTQLHFDLRSRYLELQQLARKR